jgi:hypothetical protein
MCPLLRGRIELQQTSGWRNENQRIRKGCYLTRELLLPYFSKARVIGFRYCELRGKQTATPNHNPTDLQSRYVDGPPPLPLHVRLYSGSCPIGHRTLILRPSTKVNGRQEHVEACFRGRMDIQVQRKSIDASKVWRSWTMSLPQVMTSCTSDWDRASIEVKDK